MTLTALNTNTDSIIKKLVTVFAICSLPPRQDSNWDKTRTTPLLLTK